MSETAADAIPRSSVSSPISTISSGGTKRKLIAGIRLYHPRHLRAIPMRDEQMQGVHNAGLSRVAESRDLH